MAAVSASSELLALSKLNWNNTQFDGGEPITVRAARRVGDILKCVPQGLEDPAGLSLLHVTRDLER